MRPLQQNTASEFYEANLKNDRVIFEKYVRGRSRISIQTIRYRACLCVTTCYILFTPYLDCTYTIYVVPHIRVQAKLIEPNTTKARRNICRAANSENTWVQANKCILILADKKTLLTFGSLLTGKHVNYAQTLLRHQFTNNVTGLQSTLLQYKPLIKKWAEGLQIIHCHECHWIETHKVTASRVLGIQR